eukprot:443139-Pelagomonas_calceolata.AAC.3
MIKIFEPFAFQDGRGMSAIRIYATSLILTLRTQSPPRPFSAMSMAFGDSRAGLSFQEILRLGNE